ncbi:amino acid adenylation domain-containing protein [Nocardiopsis sp. NPDC007018]|uniref:amino acid adenylation domain-containing protein n=1 Tax=Nocardiopsis sp. NPDC007018 TaxID=3155721 RepID=UPI0033ED90D9
MLTRTENPGRGAALLLDRLSRRNGAPAPEGVVPVPRDRPLPLSFSQERMWVLDRLRPGGVDYQVPVVLRLRGPLDRERLAASLNRLAERHEVLRTRYGTDDDNRPTQVVDPPSRVPVAFDDMGALPPERARRYADDLVRLDLRQPFDLESGPVWRARLVRLGDEEHLLVLVLHHVAVDGWSVGLLVDDLAERYADGGADAPAPALQYADYAHWQRSEAFEERARAGTEHWRERLAGLPALELPTDRGRPAVWEPDGATVGFEVPADLADTLAALGREHGATPFMVYLAALQAVMGRYSGQADFAVGTPVAGRTRAELEPVVGVFINMLALRADLSGNPSFAGLLERTRDTALDAFDHQEVPFERVVTALVTDRDLARNPLYQVGFVMGTGEPARFRSGPLVGEEVAVPSSAAKLDLNWALERGTDGSYTGTVTFPHALFDTATVERMAAHLVRFLENVAADPGTPVGLVGLLGDDERDAVLHRPRAWAPDAPVLHERFADRAALTPDAVALTVDGAHLTYAELDGRANRIARRLLGEGVGREDLVGVHLNRGAELVPALLGVLKAGAGYLPLDPVHPADRVAYMVRDSGVRVVLTEKALADSLDAAGDDPRVVVLDSPHEEGVLASLPRTAPRVDTDPGDRAYVIYTSGSTGRPKGVEVTHGNVVRLVTSTDERYRFDAGDVWPLFHSFAFDVSVWEIWGALLHGGRLVVVPQEVTRSPRDLLDLLVDEGVTVLNQTPTAFRGLVEMAGRDVPEMARLRLHTVVLAGEALDVESLRPWWRRFGDRVRVVNMYGITETTVHTTYRSLTPGDLDGVRSPVGPPVDDLALYVLDPALNPVPVGVPGEIHVGGPGVTRGYLNRPALTAERFVPDPFGPAGARMYRSGDKARVLADGEIEFLGRFDDQVKIRGFRIELGEVRACLASAPGVAEAVVLVDDRDGDPRLAAYVEPEPGGATSASVRAHAARVLPGYMVPSVVVEVERMPLTANGKVDKRALPSPDFSRASQETEYAAPRTPRERAVAEVWARVLGVPEVGVHDNFFALGGDSIRAVRLAGALAAAGHDYSVPDLFLHQSVAELTAAHRSGGVREEVTGTAPFALLSEDDRARVPLGAADAYPMSMTQAGMVFEMVADSEANPYHNVTDYLVRDEDGFDPHALREAAATVVARHPVLRTSFDLTSFDEQVQLVHERAEAVVGWTDLRGHDEPERVPLVRAFGDRERTTPFDLAVPPLVRFHAHVVGDTRWYLTLTECHAVLDGWSHNSTLTELLDCYREIRGGGVPDRSVAAGVRFADFVAEERLSAADPGQRGFWAGRVGAAERLDLPELWGDPDDSRQDEVTVPYADLEEGLREVALSARASLKSVLLAAHLSVWRAVHGEGPFLTGLVCNGRPEVEGGDTVRGMYLNTVPLVSFAPGADWLTAVSDVFAEEVAVWPHRRYPLPLIQREHGGSERLLDVVFNYLDFHVLDRETVDTAAGHDASPNEFALNVTTEPGALVLTARSARVSPDRLRQLAALYRSALESVVADPRGPAVCPVPAPVRGARSAAAARSVVESVAALAASRPGAVAVTSVGGDTDYGTLWGRALAWARHLGELGVGRGDLVAVCLPRDAELVAALLGVMAAGAGYAPLDAAHPDGRISWILEDTGARAVITAPELAERFRSLSRAVVLPEEVGDRPGGAPVRVGADDVAYVIHTSGSTGRPKGVVVGHGALEALVRAMGRRPGLGPDDVLAAVTTPSFDIAALELFGPLVHGGRVLLADEEQAADPGALSALLTAGRATVLQATPTQWRTLVDSGAPLPEGLRALCGGERLDPALAAAIGGRTGELWDLYGPTESTVWSAVTRHGRAGEPLDWEPVDGDEVLVLSGDLSPVPDGAVGQVCVAGAGLAHGYAGRPGLTAERFVPDPWGGGGRLYLTGDLGRRHPDGRVEILGRDDHQVKIRGFRIETGEIEAVLAAHPRVRSAVVHPVPGPDGSPRLVAYLVPEGGEATTAELRAHAARTLPEYMVPSLFTHLAAFPTTLNGKVDRAALPAPGTASASDRFVAPRGRLEEALAREWERVLEIDRVSADDDFFELGGHSLLMMRVIAAMRERTGVGLGLRDFVEHRTIARIVAESRGARERSPLVRFGGEGPGAPLYCVHPGGGSAHWYRHLAEELSGRRELVAFEWSSGESVPEIAARYLAAMRAERPEGPHLLLGWCGGGAIAWEMARALRDEGEEVRLLLLDPVGVSDEGYLSMPRELELLTRGEEICRLLDVSTPRPERDAPDTGAPDADALRAELGAILREVVEDDGGHAVTDRDAGPEWLPRLSAWRGLLRARMDYRFTAFDGDLDLLVGDELAEERHVAIEGQDYAAYLRHWRERVTGDLRVLRVPGDHLGVLRPPHAGALADTLERVLGGTAAEDGATAAP